MAGELIDSVHFPSLHTPWHRPLLHYFAALNDFDFENSCTEIMPCSAVKCSASLCDGPSFPGIGSTSPVTLTNIKLLTF